MPRCDRLPAAERSATARSAQARSMNLFDGEPDPRPRAATIPRSQARRPRDLQTISRSTAASHRRDPTTRRRDLAPLSREWLRAGARAGRMPVGHVNARAVAAIRGSPGGAVSSWAFMAPALATAASVCRACIGMSRRRGDRSSRRRACGRRCGPARWMKRGSAVGEVFVMRSSRAVFVCTIDASCERSQLARLAGEQRCNRHDWPRASRPEETVDNDHTRRRARARPP